MKTSGAKKSAIFPHLDQRGNAGGSSFSASPRTPLFSHPVRWKYLAGLFGVLFSLSAFAQVEQPLQQQIDNAIHQHLQIMMNKQATEKGWQGMRLVLENTPLTSTRQLTPCPGKIKVSGGNAIKLSRQQLTLECNSKGSAVDNWKIKVSTDMQVFLPVVVSTAVINRGETIQRNQLQTQETNIAKIQRGFYHRVDEITGMGAKRRIRANQILSPDLIDQPQLIKRGDKIKIIANRDGISASMPGEALEKGGDGEVIRVRNLSSGKTIEAKVIEAGVVTSTF